MPDSNLPATATNEPPSCLASLPDWIVAREAAVEGLRRHCASQLYFFDDSAAELRKVVDLEEGESAKPLAPRAAKQTEVAILYLHGFSASPEEIQPLPQRLATALGANLYIPRLAGHGLNGEALAGTLPEMWQRDAAEALQVAQALGQKVVVLGTSTGATLAFWLALQEEGRDSLAALLLMSPNFASRDPRGEWLRHWWGRALFRLVRGPLHGIEPLSDQHAHFWTTFFPVNAVTHLMNFVAQLRAADFNAISTPCLVAYAPADHVVNVGQIEKKFREIGSPLKKLMPVTNSDDPLQHVIAGDIRSPASTAALLGAFIEFLDSAGIPLRY